MISLKDVWLGVARRALDTYVGTANHIDHPSVNAIEAKTIVR
jgi:hypothetical protein